MSMPETVPNFLVLQDGVDDVVAAHPNDRAAAITDLGTMIGAFGNTQSYTESIRNFLRNLSRGCQLKFKTTADIYVTAGEIALTDSSGNLRLRRNTSDLTVNWTNIDTGAEENSTTYYVYAVADATGTTFTAQISKSASAPTGATYYKKLGWFYNNSSGNIEDIIGILADGRKTYDSGWFAVAATTTYTKTHGLGTTKCLITGLIAENSDGSGWCIPFNVYSYSVLSQQVHYVALSTTTITVRSDGAGGSLVDFIKSNGNRVGNITACYARILMSTLE